MRVEGLLNCSAQLFADTVAVDDGTLQWTFAELHRRVGAQVQALRDIGVQEGDRVAVLSRNRAEYVALYFSVCQVGAVLVPLNWRLTGVEVEGILADSEPRLILAEQGFSSVLGGSPWADLSTLSPEGLEVSKDGSEDIEVNGDPKQSEDVTGQNGEGVEKLDSPIAVQMYTSGTSGQPKGAMLTHRNCTAMTHAWLLDMRLEVGDRFLQVTPLFHVGGMLMVLSNVASGTTLRLLPEFDPVAAIDVLANEHTTHALFVPAMVQWLLQEPHLRDKHFTSLRLIVYGAAPMPPSTLKQASDLFGCDFLQGYGLTESSGVLLTLTPSDHRAFSGEEHGAEHTGRLASAGRAAPGCQVRVVGEDGTDVPFGQLGEIVARGDNLSPGYWKDPESTRAAWAGGWFHTGDLAHMDREGYITVVDRKKDMILVGGENVYPREVENVLLRHADIDDVAVIGIPHSVWGEEVLAVVVSSHAGDTVERVWIRHCREVLARYKCPTRVQRVAELPRNAAGKLLKRELRAPYWKEKDRLV